MDQGDIERERCINLRTAVVAFATGDLQVNLVDTPGHLDFMAEVERARPIDDDILVVVSAVEGIQAQTKILTHSVRKLGLPIILFACA